MTSSAPIFYMPVYRGEVFEPRTEAALRDAFSRFAFTSRREPVSFLEMHVLLNNPGEHSIGDKRVQMLPDPRVLDTQLTEDALSAYHDTIVAWSEDNLVEEIINALPLPWQQQWGRLKGRLMSIFWRPEFLVITQEHIPTWIKGEYDPSLAPGADAGTRALVASAILPSVSSSHEKIRSLAKFEEKRSDFHWLWQRIAAGGIPLPCITRCANGSSGYSFPKNLTGQARRCFDKLRSLIRSN